MAKLEKKDINKLFWESQWFTLGCNSEKFESMGFTLSLVPVIEKLYPNKEDQFKAYARHQEIFLTEAQCAKTVIGITAAMEERIANEGDIPEESVSAVKAAMMGPLAGIGDTLYHGTLRPIFAGIGVSLIVSSNYTSPLGSILFFVIMATIGQVINWVGIYKGYEKGTEFVASIEANGLIDKIREYASILGCIIMGGFSAAFVTINLGITFAAGETVISLQDTLNGLIPRLLPMTYTLFCYWLLTKKKAKPVVLMVLTMVGGAIGYLLGIFA